MDKMTNYNKDLDEEKECGGTASDIKELSVEYNDYIVRDRQGPDVTRLYLNDISRAKLLTADEEVKYARLMRNGDEKDRKRGRKKMIISNLRLVVTVARRYLGYGLTLLDLVQEGNLGLMRAVDKFDPERGFRFSTYATWWIRQNVERGIMNQGRTIRVPVHILKEINRCRKASREYQRSHGHEPSIEVLAQLVKKSPQDVKRLLTYAEHTVSGDELLGPQQNQTILDTVSDSTDKTPMELLQQMKIRQSVSTWLGMLSPRQREVIVRRFGFDDKKEGTLEEVGCEIGVTRERARQIQIEALAFMKQIATENRFDRHCW